MASNDGDQVLVRAKRPFEGVEGFKDETSEPFTVSRYRAAELQANGLVEIDDGKGGAKSAPTPENKMAAPPANKVRSDAARGERA